MSRNFSRQRRSTRLPRLAAKLGSAGAPHGGQTRSQAVQSLAALALLGVVSVLVGMVLGASKERLETTAGLLMMVPAAIALRGNIFGALGSRLGTAIHAGTYQLSMRPASVMGENVLASISPQPRSLGGVGGIGKGGRLAFWHSRFHQPGVIPGDQRSGRSARLAYRAGRRPVVGCGLGAFRLGSRQCHGSDGYRY